MEEIIRLENEVLLNILEIELNKIGIEYLVKKINVSNLPVNTDDFAILFSEIKNKSTILEIYDNIKYSQEKEKENNKKLDNTIIKNILRIIIFVVLIIIIIFQHKVIQNYYKALTVNSGEYIYKWSSDVKETYIYTKDGYLLQKNIDRDRNNIIEIMEVYYPNGLIGIYEDFNQNSFFEKYTLYKNDIKTEEGFSTNDDGIYDVIYYYKDGEINQTLIYDIENNIIKIE